MPGTRGFVRAIYQGDAGVQFQLLVDADSAADPNRGWVVLGEEVLPYLPRGFLPRRVVGIDETGRQVSTRVATVSAALWDGSVVQWTFEGSDLALHTATLTNRQQERQIGPGTRDQ